MVRNNCFFVEMSIAKKFMVAGLVKSILGLSVIDTSAFTASTRSASTSKVKGLSIVDILKRGNWSSKSTRQKLHHKFVPNESALFQNIIGLSLLCAEDNGRMAGQINGTGTTGWENSALDQRKFYGIRLSNFVRSRSARKKTEVV